MKMAKKMLIGFNPIFQIVGGRHDSKRLECSIEEPEDPPQGKQSKATRADNEIKAAIFDAVNNIVRRFDKNWRVLSCSFLKSLPGGKEQEVHRDYSVADVAKALEKHSTMPASVIVALMPGTKIGVCRYSDDLVSMQSKTDIGIEVGDCLIFRGDLPHCGLSYDKENIRIHCYIGHGQQDFEIGGTHPVTFVMEKCQFAKCGRQFNTPSLLKHHERRCRFNPDRAAVDAAKAKDKARDMVTVKCNCCEKLHRLWRTYTTCVRRWNKTHPPNQQVVPMKKSSVAARQARQVESEPSPVTTPSPVKTKPKTVQTRKRKAEAEKIRISKKAKTQQKTSDSASDYSPNDDIVAMQVALSDDDI